MREARKRHDLLFGSPTVAVETPASTSVRVTGAVAQARPVSPKKPSKFDRADKAGGGKASGGKGGGKGGGQGKASGGKGGGRQDDKSAKAGGGSASDYASDAKRARIQCFKCHEYGHFADKCPKNW